MKSFKDYLGGQVSEDKSELQDFVKVVKEINELLTKASSMASSLSKLKDDGLKKQASELEKKIDTARDYAFKIR